MALSGRDVAPTVAGRADLERRPALNGTEMPRRSLLAFGIVLCLLLAGLNAWNLVESRRVVLETARSSTLDTVKLIAEHTARSLDTVDLVLRSFAVTYPRYGSTPTDARGRLEELLVKLPQVVSFRVIDAEGQVRVAAGPTASLPHQVSSYAYWRHHKDEPRGSLSIGEPRVAGDQWSIPVSRRIDLPNGDFGGIVVANLDGRYFHDLYRRSSNLHTTSLGLWRSDGLLLARFPGSGAQVGQTMFPFEVNADLFEEPRALEGPSAWDGRMRIVGLGPVPDLPLAVTVSIDRGQSLADWRRGVWRDLLVMVTALAIILGGVWLLSVQIRRAQRATAQREAAVEGSLHGYYFLRSLRDDTGKIIDFTIADMNRRAEQMMTKPRAHWIGRRLCEAVPINRTHGLVEHYKQVVETQQPFEMELPLESPDVKPKWMRIQALPLEDGVVVAARDITDDKCEELARQLAERRLSDIAETVPGMVYQFVLWPNGQKTFSFVSSGVRDLYGCEPEDAERDAAVLLNEVVPDDLERFDESILCSAETLTPWQCDYRILRDGAVRWLRGRARPQRRADGAVVWNGVVIDITEERKLQDETLEAREEAELANRAKSNFLANMSHELRTPLNAVIGFSDALQQGFGGTLNERQTEYIGHVQAAGRHLLGIIGDLLDLAKIEAGQADLKETLFSPLDVVASAVALISARAASKQLSLDIDDLSDLPTVRGDARRFKQVLLNLLSNAVKFTPDGGRVRIGAELQSDGWLRFWVDDNGLGMHPADVEVALRPFGQVRDSFVRGEGGTGLGLPLSQQLLELHGGRLTIDSRPGEGTVVSALLPPERLLLQSRQTAVDDENPSGSLKAAI
ncbi:ATP-binding protein [Algihabitans albus]|uniref:ATP-binding protein n=1 Tax=Algihabitans albus TaxID=2164067 RepID=UPI000E5C5D03|nr:ATP-binding protein [Algihabitans albus]